MVLKVSGIQKYIHTFLKTQNSRGLIYFFKILKYVKKGLFGMHYVNQRENLRIQSYELKKVFFFLSKIS